MDARITYKILDRAAPNGSVCSLCKLHGASMHCVVFDDSTAGSEVYRVACCARCGANLLIAFETLQAAMQQQTWPTEPAAKLSYQA